MGEDNYSMTWDRPPSNLMEANTRIAALQETIARFAQSIANVAVFTSGRSDLTGDEVAALLRNEIPKRLQ